MGTKKLYQCIVADPPWSKNQKGKYGAIQHYDLMTTEQIKAMPVGSLAADNAACWVWVTNSTIYEGYEVLRSWGFEPKSILTWFKFRPQLGLGMTLRNDTEHVLLGIKGKLPIAVHNQQSWFVAPTREHSRKPDEFFCIAERCYPDGPFLELFARRKYHPKWDIWGNEIESDLEIPGYPVPKSPATQKQKGAEHE